MQSHETRVRNEENLPREQGGDVLFRDAASLRVDPFVICPSATFLLCSSKVERSCICGCCGVRNMRKSLWGGLSFVYEDEIFHLCRVISRKVSFFEKCSFFLNKLVNHKLNL